MRTTQSLSITLPHDMAQMVRAKVSSGEYATESEVIRDGLRVLDQLAEAVRARLLALAGSRVTQDGELLITARRFRSQERNRQDAIRRLTHLIERASAPSRLRVPTRPTRHAQELRLNQKRRHSEQKRARHTDFPNSDE